MRTTIEPIFPQPLPLLVLSGTVLLPRAQLPLTLTHQDQLALFEKALRNDRLLGLVQPLEEGKPSLFKSGCLGKITAFNENEDGTVFLILRGLCRFDIMEEIPSEDPYPHAVVRYEPFSGDKVDGSMGIERRPYFLNLMERYFDLCEINANLEEMASISDDNLITCLAMVCPFAPQEKQAILETADIKDRSRIVEALMEMAFLKESNKPWIQH